MSLNVVCPPLLVPETQNCTGRGVCLDQFHCACDVNSGFIGNGDFAFGTPSCAINIAAIQALWSLVIILQMALLPFTVMFLRIKLKQKLRTIPPIVLGALVFVFSLCILITGFIRAVNPARTIGTDPYVTLAFSFGSAAFWASVHVFIYAFIDLSLRQSRMSRDVEATQKILLQMKLILPVSSLISIIGCFLPLGMLSATDAGQVQRLATSHYLLLAGELALTGIFVTPFFIRRVVNEISDVAKSNPSKSGVLQVIVKKLNRFQSELIKQAISNLLFAFLFGVWPFLQVYGSSYFLPFAWTSGTIVGALGLYVNLPVADKKSSSAPEKDSSIQPSSSGGNGNKTDTAGKILTAHGSTYMIDSSYAENGSIIF